MAIIYRKRTLRPSTRKASSFNYRVHVDNILAVDTLEVTITHEIEPVELYFRFSGNDLQHKNNISFRPEKSGDKWHINWSGAQPINNSL